MAPTKVLMIYQVHGISAAMLELGRRIMPMLSSDRSLSAALLCIAGKLKFHSFVFRNSAEGETDVRYA